MIEQQLDIKTADGATTTFVVHPERGGPHPAILFFMDAPAIREELRDMARRLATAGYYVVLPNLYYREGVMEIGPLGDPAVRERMMALMAGLSIDMVMRDTKSLIAWIDTQGAASNGPMGAVGYCMSGQFAINAAARFPDRIKAAASMYGTYLVTDKADSPHTMARQAKGELYFGCAETDRWAPMETVQALDAALKADKVHAEVELYPGVEHGFAFPQRPAYDKTAAERHWERLLALYRRNLG
jgi:carboxymethylenebutenolidase